MAQPTVVGTAGTGVDATAQNGANLTITLPVGTTVGDMVILVGIHSNRAGSTPQAVTAGYTTLASHSAASPFAVAQYKILGNPADSTVTCKGSGNAADAAAYVCAVIRGASEANISIQSAGPTTGTNPDPPSISGVDTANDIVIAAAVSAVFDAAVTAPTGYGNLANAAGNDTGEDCAAALAINTTTLSSTEDPAAFTNWSSGANYRFTIRVGATVFSAVWAKNSNGLILPLAG